MFKLKRTNNKILYFKSKANTSDISLKKYKIKLFETSTLKSFSVKFN